MDAKIKGFWTYENKMVLTLCLAFGFVMFDRFALANLSVYVLPDLGMNNAQLGVATSAFAFSWAIIGLFGSWFADSKGSRKALLAGIVLVFSVCSLLTGLATGFIMLVFIRLIMGASEGPVMPVSQSFIIPQSTPSRRGLNMGLMQIVAVGLISSLFGPLIQVALAESIGWRWTFVVTIIPGIIVAIMIAKILINPQTRAEADRHAEAEGRAREKAKISTVLGKRNIILSIVGTIFLLCWYICMLTYTPGYLVNVKGLDPSYMSYVMSAFGAGAIFWGIVVPGLSDKVGRKPMVLIAAALGVFSSIGILFAPSSLPLLMLIAFVGWGGVGVCALMQSTIPAESGDPRFVATIIGTNQLTGELLGGSGGAILLGILADRYGLHAAILGCGISMAVALVVALFYKESAPMVLERRERAKARQHTWRES
jgi:predicted MFS family arabinose efflux permease